MRAICFTSATVVSSHCPKIVYPPFKCGVATSVMKNCEPFVFGPEFAYARRPGLIEEQVGRSFVLKLDNPDRPFRFPRDLHPES